MNDKPVSISAQASSLKQELIREAREEKRQRRWQWLRGWFPQLSYGETHWCGRFFVLHAPRHISVAAGRGTSGLYLFRWTERGGEIIRRDRADRKRRGLL